MAQCEQCRDRYIPGDNRFCHDCLGRMRDGTRPNRPQNLTIDLSKGCTNAALGCGIGVGIVLFLLVLLFACV